MKEKRNRAIEVTTVVSGYSIPLGLPEKCPEHFLQWFPTRDRTLGVYPAGSILHWLRVAPGVSSPSCFWEEEVLAHRVFGGRNSRGEQETEARCCHQEVSLSLDGTAHLPCNQTWAREGDTKHQRHLLPSPRRLTVCPEVSEIHQFPSGSCGSCRVEFRR